MSHLPRPVWRSTAWVLAWTVLAALALSGLTFGAPAQAVPYIFGAASIVASATVLWAWLRTRRLRRTYETRLTAWAAREAVHAERLRVARDLHDLVSHSLGFITLRAAAAHRHSGPDTRREHAAALGDIEDAARDATTELRRMLGLLRDETPEPAPVHPAARLDDLPALIADSRRFGLDVELHLGEVREVTPGVQLAVYAIVREALTNAARHAGPTHVAVRVHRDADTVAVSIHDTGPVESWNARPGAGHGLIGLRERAENLGGSLLARPTTSGFQLDAHLPDPVTA